MAIQSFAGSSVSTEGIVTVKITTPVTYTSFPVPLSPGNYRIDTGYSGTLYVSINDSSDNSLVSFTFATTSFFTVPATASKVLISGPVGAVNGVISVQQLKRGTLGGAVWYTIPVAGLNYRNSALIPCNGRLYMVGGNASGGYDAYDGTGVIRYWDKNTSNLTMTTQYSATNFAGQTFGVASGTNLYFYCKGGGQSTAQGFYKFDTVAGTLTTLASMPAYANGALNNIVINNAGTKIYRFGNWSQANSSGAAVYDIASNSWSQLANTPYGDWGVGHHRDPSNADRINFFGHSSQTQRYRYNITANTYTALGSAGNHNTADSTYTTQGGITPNGSYYVFGGSNSLINTSAIPYQTYRQIKTDGTVDATTVSSDSFSALPFKPNGNPNGGSSYIQFDSDYMYVLEGLASDSSAQPYLWIIAKSYLPSAWRV